MTGTQEDERDLFTKIELGAIVVVALWQAVISPGSLARGLGSATGTGIAFLGIWAVLKLLKRYIAAQLPDRIPKILTSRAHHAAVVVGALFSGFAAAAGSSMSTTGGFLGVYLLVALFAIVVSAIARAGFSVTSAGESSSE